MTRNDDVTATELHTGNAPTPVKRDPFGREVIPNEPLPRQPLWQELLAVVGILATLFYMFLFAQALVDNISVPVGGDAPFINVGIALMGSLLCLSLLIGYGRWFSVRGGLTQLITLLIVTFAPAALYYL